MHFLQMKTCSQVSGLIRIEDDKAWEIWAMYSDALLTQQQIPVEIPDMQPDDHIVQIALMGAKDLTPDKRFLFASVYLLCDHLLEIANNGTASATPQLIVPRR